MLKYETPLSMLIKALVIGLIIGGGVIYSMSKTLLPVPTPVNVEEHIHAK